MAGELKISFPPNRTVYFMVLSSSGQVWRTDTNVWEAYNTSNVSAYAVSAVQQGTASSLYLGTFPTQIAAGVYDALAKQQVGGSVSEGDPTVGSEDGFSWTGSARVSLSDLATSGQVGQFSPIRLARSWQILNYPIYLKSAVDHVTPMTSGVVSGQISKDGGAFGPLQSGAFTEVGMGFFRTTLTSGDLAANTIALLFTAAGISGGTSDPLPQAYITQRTSGY